MTAHQGAQRELVLAVLPNDDGIGDVLYVDDVIVEGRDLETAVYHSLFWDAPALPDDDIPDGVTRRGFWADSFNTDGDVTGSRLWLLSRAKVVEASIADAKVYAEEALAWMVRDGVARSVLVTSERLILTPDTQGIAIAVIIYRPNGERFAWAWDALTGEAV